MFPLDINQHRSLTTIFKSGGYHFSNSTQVGIALKAATPVESLLSLVDSVDVVLVLTTEHGGRGQSEVTNSALQKVAVLRQRCPDLLVKTDGLDELARDRVS